MTKSDARKIRQVIDHYQATKGSHPEIADQCIVSLLGFMDGYVSAVLSQPDENS